METLVGQDTLSQLPPEKAADITGKTFFPELISDPFIDGLRIAFTASLIMCLIAAWASWMRGAKYVHSEDEESTGEALAESLPDEWVPA
jgi:hypothetical protein